MHHHFKSWAILPTGSMYDIFGSIWLIFMINVGKYAIHGSYGLCNIMQHLSNNQLGVPPRPSEKKTIHPFTVQKP